MCKTPKVEEPKQLQASKEPVFNSSATDLSKHGHKGTILTQPLTSPVVAPAVAGGKTLLGG
ncbi:hypothetical protein [Paracoccus sp. PAR01]|uniref:hypothetical protein n=1 Tax=Paracoccus sp. PAR01 TaxID=2769282 RepID=UPI0017812759|nr:hypothetical protein [Paracoccus sp. PAR01]MBD9528246.1 hypothetical protein [Paracoccus sp. PAR01]